jgi:RHS repeat-associated protein
LVEDKINEIQTLATDNLIMQEAGFLEVYINNEAQTPVYYDNFTVAATTSNVTEINAYYPYGMIIPGLSLMATPGKWNGYKYSEKELQTELGLNWGDHGARMADYIIGRWRVPDPLSDERYDISNYAYASNNPVNRIDLDGMSDGWYEDELKRMIFDASINSQQDLKNAGIEGSYIGDTGYGIDGATGNMLGYNSDGSITDMGANKLSGATVTGQMSRHAQIMSNPTVQNIHGTYARFLYGPEAMFVYSLLPVGGAAGAAGKVLGGAAKVSKVARPIVQVAAKGGTKLIGKTRRGFKSLGAAGRGFSKTLQTGEHTLNKSTLKALKITKEQGKIAIEALKKDVGVPNNFHAKIMDNGDYINAHTGEWIGNLFDYIP